MIEILPEAEAYVGGVIPAPLNKEKYDPTLGSRADRLEKSVRLLTVMNLMQQGWELYADYWYKLFEVELMWVPAENFCRELGGHLVSIKDVAENHFVHKLRKSMFFFLFNPINEMPKILRK
uniref:C-type lectin domain-containing protein n=2 Tax=Panagrolaimus TaxID=55784 RepID=A0A914YXH3_9BILA